jgi:hypothetical protein
MKIYSFFIGLAFLVAVKCDLLEEQFFRHVYKDILIKESDDIKSALVRTRFFTMSLNAAYDALAPYLLKSIGISSFIPRRPKNERTQRNKNIAVAYAILRITQSVFPPAVPKLISLYQSLGLDINDATLDLTTSIGIGNFAAKNVLDERINDGINQLGNMNGKKYNRIPYEDYTGYVPKNTAYELKFPGKWQPQIENLGFGTFVVQQYLVPQYAITKPYAIKNPTNFTSPVPRNSNPSNRIGYKKQVDDVLSLSANLNDYRKMASEQFDGMITAFYDPVFFLAEKNMIQSDNFIILSLLHNIALFDASIVKWQEKLSYEAVRPISSVKYLYENTSLTAWGGPGVGIVSDITGREWKPYLLTTPAHGEYPAGHSCNCAVQEDILKRFFGTNELGYSVVKPKGSSVVEPNVTPSNDIILGPYETLDEYTNECSISRMWAGVHFKAGIEEGERLCKPLGEIVFDFVMYHVRGKVV